MSQALIAVLFAAAVLSAPAAAQRGGEVLPTDQAEAELAGYADCVVAKKAFRGPVTAFLRVIPDSAGFYPASMKAADMTCLNDAAVRRRAGKLEMRLQPGRFREALYPALYRRDFGKRGVPAGVTATAPLDFAAEFDGETAALPTGYRVQRAIGDCVARAAPAGAHALLLSEPHSAAETAAVGQLTPSLGGCLPAGQTAQVSRARLRAAVGEALYKLARQAGGAAQS